MSNIKEQIRQEIDTRRQHMVEELMGHEENCEYHRIKGMHDAYVDLLTFLDYSLPEETNRAASTMAPSCWGEEQGEVELVNDLEEAAKEYASKTLCDPDDGPSTGLAKESFIAGAKWMKERMIKDAKEIITVQRSLTEPEFVKQRVIFLKEG